MTHVFLPSLLLAPANSDVSRTRGSLSSQSDIVVAKDLTSAVTNVNLPGKVKENYQRFREKNGFGTAGTSLISYENLARGGSLAICG